MLIGLAGFTRFEKIVRAAYDILETTTDCGTTFVLEFNLNYQRRPPSPEKTDDDTNKDDDDDDDDDEVYHVSHVRLYRSTNFEAMFRLRDLLSQICNIITNTELPTNHPLRWLFERCKGWWFTATNKTINNNNRNNGNSSSSSSSNSSDNSNSEDDETSIKNFSYARCNLLIIPIVLPPNNHERDEDDDDVETSSLFRCEKNLHRLLLNLSNIVNDNLDATDRNLVSCLTLFDHYAHCLRDLAGLVDVTTATTNLQYRNNSNFHVANDFVYVAWNRDMYERYMRRALNEIANDSVLFNNNNDERKKRGGGGGGGGDTISMKHVKRLHGRRQTFFKLKGVYLSSIEAINSTKMRYSKPLILSESDSWVLRTRKIRQCKKKKDIVKMSSAVSSSSSSLSSSTGGEVIDSGHDLLLSTEQRYAANIILCNCLREETYANEREENSRRRSRILIDGVAGSGKTFILRYLLTSGMHVLYLVKKRINKNTAENEYRNWKESAECTGTLEAKTVDAYLMSELGYSSLFEWIADQTKYSDNIEYFRNRVLRRNRLYYLGSGVDDQQQQQQRRIIFIDEIGLIPQQQISVLFEVCPANVNILAAGDCNQCPPIGDDPMVPYRSVWFFDIVVLFYVNIRASLDPDLSLRLNCFQRYDNAALALLGLPMKNTVDLRPALLRWRDAVLSVSNNDDPTMIADISKIVEFPKIIAKSNLQINYVNWAIGEQVFALCLDMDEKYLQVEQPRFCRRYWRYVYAASSSSDVLNWRLEKNELKEDPFCKELFLVVGMEYRMVRSIGTLDRGTRVILLRIGNRNDTTTTATTTTIEASNENILELTEYECVRASTTNGEEKNEDLSSSSKRKKQKTTIRDEVEINYWHVDVRPVGSTEIIRLFPCPVTPYEYNSVWGRNCNLNNRNSDDRGSSRGSGSNDGGKFLFFMFPIIADCAITIYQAQGLTLRAKEYPYCYVDMFQLTKNELYVALSRFETSRQICGFLNVGYV